MASTKHVLLFPFPGQGHLAAFMSLADLLHRAIPSAAVTLVSTPRNVTALYATAPPWLAFHSLPFSPADHGLPPHAESADALPAGVRMVTLFEAFEALQPAFDGYVASTAKDGAVVLIVSDLFLAWTAGVARRNGCSHAFFASCGAFGTVIFRSLWMNVPLSVMPTGHVHVPVPGFPDKIFHRTQVSEILLRADGEDRGSAFCHRQIAHGHATDGVLVNTVEEFEPTGLRMLRSSLRVPVWPIGPLIRVAGARPAVSADAVDDGVINWLDTQAPASVLYVSFGSQNSIRQPQMAVLAKALEHTGRPFIWVIRPPVGFAGVEWLPEGFEKRARDGNRGLIVRGWAPQVKILAHRSTGAFLSHCGWNSVLESLVHGVPLVGWPLAADQFYNVEMLERECGVCVEVARGNTEDAALPEVERVAELVETVMGETSKAAEMRRRMTEIGELMRGAATEHGGSSKKALEEFLEAMRMH